jgi:hypothetical protein
MVASGQENSGTGDGKIFTGIILNWQRRSRGDHETGRRENIKCDVIPYSRPLCAIDGAQYEPTHPKAFSCCEALAACR